MYLNIYKRIYEEDSASYSKLYLIPRVAVCSKSVVLLLLVLFLLLSIIVCIIMSFLVWQSFAEEERSGGFTKYCVLAFRCMSWFNCLFLLMPLVDDWIFWSDKLYTGFAQA